jgi:hypothetical protein
VHVGRERTLSSVGDLEDSGEVMAGSAADLPALPGLGDYMRRIGSARDRGERAAAFAALAHEADRTDNASYLLDRLLSRGANGQRLALEVAARLTPPLPPEHVSALADLVENPRFPTKVRVPLAAQIMRSVPTYSKINERVVDALRRHVAPNRAMNRLRRLAALVQPPPYLSRALGELDSGSTAPCPRCGARLGPDELVKHLWERHRLLLENGRVREPWDVIGQWVNDFARTSKPEYLDRACELAQALDPTDGLTRVHRLLLLGGTDDEEAHNLLRAEAAEKNATLCPHCFAVVPQPTRAVPAAVLIGSGRVDGGGFRVDLGDRYMFNALRVDTPEATVFNGPEPGHTLTRRGAVLAFLIPLTMMALLFAAMPRLLGLAPIIPVLGFLVAGLFAYIGVRATWMDTGDAANRATDHTWSLLVPKLLTHENSRTDAAFLAGLAVASRGHGEAEDREEQVRRSIAALRRDHVGIPYLTPLSVLRIADAATADGDDVPMIANEVGDSFDAALPLDHAEGVIKELRGDPIDRTRRVRLRILILARAFGAGLEAEDLRMIGQVCPMLGASYASEDRDGLARLKLLWLYRPRRLWQRIGSATAVFDLARYPKLAENYLRLRPDLLLFQASGGVDAAPILVCEEGVVYRDTVITRPDPVIRVRARSLVRGGGFEMTIDDHVHRLRDDPTLLARRLKGWAAFLFREFLPRARMLTRRRSEHGDRLLTQKAISCPECRKTFLGLTGEIGLTAMPPANEGVE